MKVMVIVKATKNSEAGGLPNEKLLAEMGKFNEQLVKAGVMLAAEGLHPSSRGKRLRFSGGKKMVIDGPFAETQGTRRRLLDLAGEVAGGGARVGQALGRPAAARRPLEHALEQHQYTAGDAGTDLGVVLKADGAAPRGCP